MSVRGLWVLSRAEKNGELLFSRRFPTVERRQEMSCKKTEGSKYFPLPTDADMLTAVLKFHNCEDDRFVEERDSCTIQRQPPTYELFEGQLWPVVWIVQGHLVYVAVAMAEPLAGGKRKPLLELTSVTVSLQLLQSMIEMVAPEAERGELTKDSSIFTDLLMFVCWCAPFGNPNDLSIVNFKAVQQIPQKVKQMAVRARETQIVQPAWRLINHKGSSKLILIVREYVRAAVYDSQSIPNALDVYGTVRTRCEIEGHPEVQFSLTMLKGNPVLNNVIVHPRVITADTDQFDLQITAGGDVSRKFRFSALLEPFDLCHYTVPDIKQLPVEGYYQMEGTSTSVRLLIQLKLNPRVKNDFEVCNVEIPFYHRGCITDINNLDQSPTWSTVNMSANRRCLLWSIGQRFPIKGLEAFLQCDVVFSNEPPPRDINFPEDPFCINNNAYIKVAFKTRDYVYSSCKIDSRSITYFPTAKCKVTIGYEFSSENYRIWNSRGDCEVAYTPTTV